jgi:hypothetical protein
MAPGRLSAGRLRAGVDIDAAARELSAAAQHGADDRGPLAVHDSRSLEDILCRIERDCQ